MKHIPPTTKQKLAIYKQALKEIKRGNSYGICCAISSAEHILKLEENLVNYFSTISPIRDADNNMKINFPEIVQYKPFNKNYYEYWWQPYTPEGKQIRVKILEREIASLKAQERELFLNKWFGWLTIETEI